MLMMNGTDKAEVHVMRLLGSLAIRLYEQAPSILRQSWASLPLVWAYYLLVQSTDTPSLGVGDISKQPENLRSF